MAKKEPVEIVIIADRSGSMGSIRSEAIGGLNTFIEAQQSIKGAANLTLALYDDKYEVPLDSVKLKNVKPLTHEDFVPRGMTATYDAVGKTLATLEAKNPQRAIIMIVTDGGENASREYTAAQVKEKVVAAEARGWEVHFLAQNLDVQEYAQTLGFSNTAVFGAGGRGIGQTYASASASTRSYRSEPTTTIKGEVQ